MFPGTTSLPALLPVWPPAMSGPPESLAAPVPPPPPPPAPCLPLLGPRPQHKLLNLTGVLPPLQPEDMQVNK